MFSDDEAVIVPEMSLVIEDNWDDILLDPSSAEFIQLSSEVVNEV